MLSAIQAPGGLVLSVFTPIAAVGAGVLIGALVWLLLIAVAASRSAPEDKTCTKCGAPVFDDWRLCPDCGQFIEPVGGDS
jgi:hypothetical protein